jgi:PAS domain S-box-containing protein
MLGYTAKEFSKIKLQDVTYALDKKMSSNKRALLYKNQIESYKIDKRYVRKNGEIVWAKTSVTGVKDSNNKVIYHVTTVEDITKEKEALEKLKDSENRLAVLIGNLNSGIVMVGHRNVVKVVNKKFFEIFNKIKSPLIGNQISKFNGIAKKYFKNPEQFIEINNLAIQHNDEVYKQELELIDGRIIERSGIPIIQDQVYKGYVWTYQDVTLGRRYEENLEAQKEKFSNIIANMNLGLVEVNKDDEIVFVNQSFCNISGYSFDELVGKKAAKLLLSKKSKQIFEERMKRINVGESDSYEIEVHTKNGETRNWLISGAPNYNVQGEIIGSIGIHLDITDQKILEKQKEELLKNLEKQNEQLNDYAHIVSHDLKSPLRSISALLTWTKEDFETKLGKESLMNLNLMEDKVEKMDKLIGDILNYSSIEKDGMNTEDVDVNKIIDTIKKTVYVPNHIKINVKKQLPIIKADATRIQQLFQNIISNAVNYIDKEKGLVEVDYKVNDEFFIFSVKDNGVGIAEENFDKIFKMFTTFGDYEKSTGIGLSIVKKVVELYKGNIWLESKLGIGTTFFFSIKK